MDRFKRKGRFSGRMARIAIHVITARAALIGAAAYGLEGLQHCSAWRHRSMAPTDPGAKVSRGTLDQWVFSPASGAASTFHATSHSHGYVVALWGR